MARMWRYRQVDRVLGPISSAQLRTLVDEGKLGPDDMVQMDGMELWVHASSIKGLDFPKSISSLPQTTLPNTRPHNDVAEIAHQCVTDDGTAVTLFNDGTWCRDLQRMSKMQQTKTPVHSRVNTETHFRRSTWGMSLNEVIASENATPALQDENTLYFDVTLAKMPTRAIYVFVSNTLVRAKYFVLQQHSNENLFLDDFHSLKDSLQRKYGDPDNTFDEYRWSDDLYRDDPSDWGKAVAIGHLKLCAKWETTDTIVFLCLRGDNFETELFVEYLSKQLQHLEDQATESQLSDDL